MAGNPFEGQFSSATSTPAPAANPFAGQFGASASPAPAQSSAPSAPVASAAPVAAKPTGDPLADAMQVAVQNGKISGADAPKVLAQANGTLSPTATVATQLFPSTTQTLADFQLDPLDLKANPAKYGPTLGATIGQSILSEKQNIYDFFSGVDQKASAATDIDAGTKVATGAINMAISPFAGVITAAENIPVIGTAARLITAAFDVVGEGSKIAGKAIATPIVNKLPISDDSKAKVVDAFSSVYSLAAQISAGGSTEDIVHGLADKFSPEDVATIEKSAQAVAAGADIVPKTTLADVTPEEDEKGKLPMPSDEEIDATAKQSGSEEPVPNNRTPVQNNKTVDLTPKATDLDIKAPDTRSPMDALADKVNTGKPVTDVIPPKTPVTVKGSDAQYKVTEDTGAPTTKVVDMRTGEEQAVPRESVKIVKPVADEITTKPAVKTAETEAEEAPAPDEGSKISDEPNPAVRIKKGTEILESKFKDDPRFEKTSFKEQSEIYTKLIGEDRAKLIDYATKKVKAPDGVVPAAMAELLGKDPTLTGAEALRLGEKPFATSEAGQGLSLSRLGDEHDPAKIIRDVNDKNDAKAGITDDKVKAEAKKIEKAVKAPSPKVDWNAFVDSITC